MKCPDCKGKGSIEIYPDFVQVGTFKTNCKTCGGTGEMNELEYNNSDPTKETFIGVDKIQEELAEYAHKQWSGWMEYLFNKCTLHEGTMIIPVWAVVRWQKQIKTSYKDLSEEEKISDRSEADGMLEILSRDEEIKKLKEALKYILQLEDTISDGKIPQFFLKSTGRRYKANKETCINDIRRMLMYFWNIKIKALKDIT